ncbi:MAG: glycoside hydrolase family 38 N-terminal domain-containing protein [Armatimonadota bacterium]
MSSENRTYKGIVHVLPYTHADIAWVHTRDWHLDRYARVMDEALALFESNPDYHYYVDTWIEFVKPYLEFRPESADAIRKFITQGRLTVCAGQFGNVRSTNIGNETFIRNMQLGSRQWKQFAPDVELKVHSNIDVTFGHSQMPQLLSLMDVKAYFVMRPIAALDDQGIPRAFIWKGLSGDKTIMCRDTGVGLFQEFERHGANWDSNWDVTSEYLWNAYLSTPAKGGVGNIALTVGIDDGRPERFGLSDAPADYDEMIRIWNEREQSHMQYSSPNKLIDGLIAEYDKLKVVDEVLEPTDVSFNITVNGREGIWWLREQADRLLVESEIIDAMAVYAGKSSFDNDAYVVEWEKLLSWTPHAVQWLFRQDWREGSITLDKLALDAEKRIKKSSNTLTGGKLPMDSAGYALVGTVPGRKTEVVPLWLLNGDLTRDISRLVDAQGNEVPYQVVDVPASNSELSILAEVKSPGCGYTTLKIEWMDSPSGVTFTEALALWKTKYKLTDRKVIVDDNLELSNGLIKLSFKDGQIVSIKDLETGMKRKGSDGASFFEPVSYPITRTGWSSDAVTDNPEPFVVDEIRLDESGPLRWRVTRTGKAGGFWIRQNIDLLKGEKLAHSTVQFLAPGDNSDAFITMSMPVSEDATFNVDIPFGVEPRDVKNIKYGISERAIPGFFWGRTWANAYDSEGSIALVAGDGDKFFRAYGEPRRLVHFMAQKTRVFDCDWEGYIDTFNAGGRQVFTHMIVMGETCGQQERLIELAERLRHPVRTTYVPADRIGTEEEFVKLAPSTVCLSSMYYEDGKQIIRLVQMAPVSAKTVVELAKPVKSAKTVDLNGNPMASDISVDGKSIKLSIGAWKIATIVVE